MATKKKSLARAFDRKSNENQPSEALTRKLDETEQKLRDTEATLANQAEARAYAEAQLQAAKEAAVIDGQTARTVTPCAMDIDEIIDRSLHSSPIADSDVQTMVYRIETDGGLMVPIVVDENNMPLGGQTRSSAIRWMKKNEPAKYQTYFATGVPCLRMSGVSFDKDKFDAYFVMHAIQTQRKTPTGQARKQAIRDDAEFLTKDPKCWNKPGKVPRGNYSLIRRLASMYHCNEKTIRRALEDNTPKTPPTKNHLSGPRQQIARVAEQVRSATSFPNHADLTKLLVEYDTWVMQKESES